MFSLGFLFQGLAYVLNSVLWLMHWVIIIRAIISWVNPDPFNQFVIILRRVTEPILYPIRRALPMMSIDFSPIIALLAIMFLRIFLVQTLFELGRRLQ